jgi:hypothetical protein
MKTIALSGGMEALVDDEDYERLAQYRWYASRSNTKWYACRYEGSGRYRCRKGVHRPNRRIYMHRDLLDAPLVDHRDGNSLNNQRDNLRAGDKQKNAWNGVGQPGSSSRFKGVFWDGQYKKWMAQLKVSGKLIFRARFESEIDAARA